MSRDVTFDKSKMGDLTRYSRTTVSGFDREEFQLEVELAHIDETSEQKPEMVESSTPTEAVQEAPVISFRSLAEDRSRRAPRPPIRYGYADATTYALSTAIKENLDESATFKEAVTCEEKQQWISAMEEGMESLHKNKIWELVDIA